MKVPSNGASGSNSGEGKKESINSELWHACAGPLVSLPPVGSLVVYFPQGHSEQVAASMQKEIDSVPNYPTFPSKLICSLHNVALLADSETDEVYARMTLQPVNKYDKEALLASDVSLKNSRQPAEFFCKTLTASDTSTHGGFSVPRRAAEKIFPPLDYSVQPPFQEIVAKDLHGFTWKFRHIYRGQPKRHLLTTGWSVFVSTKRLSAGDSVLFIQDEKSQLLLGIRRANRQQPALASSVLSSDSMHIGILAAAAHASANNSPFTIYYNPRASPSEFVVPLAKYNKAMYTQVSLGMRFRMMFETEECGVRRYMGTVTGINDLDPIRWKNSQWRNLQVGWDESVAGERRDRVSVWEIEPVLSPFYICPQFFGSKYPKQPGMPDDGSEMENAFKRVLPWHGTDIGTKDTQAQLFPGLSLAQWMSMQQNSKLIASTMQSTNTPPVIAAALHSNHVTHDDPSKMMNFQSLASPFPTSDFNVSKINQQNQNAAQFPHAPQTWPNQPQQSLINTQTQQLNPTINTLKQPQQLNLSSPVTQSLQSVPTNPQSGVPQHLPPVPVQNQVLQQSLSHSQFQVPNQPFLSPSTSNQQLSHQNHTQQTTILQTLPNQKDMESQAQLQRLQPLSISQQQIQLQLWQKLQQQQQLLSQLSPQLQSQLPQNPPVQTQLPPNVSPQYSQPLTNQSQVSINQLVGQINKSSVPVGGHSRITDVDLPSCSISPSDNNVQLSGSRYITRAPQTPARFIDETSAQISNQELQNKPNTWVKHEASTSKEPEQLMNRSAITDHMDASSSATSFGMDSSVHQNFSLPSFCVDGEVQDDSRNQTLFGAHTEVLTPDTLLSKGFGSGQDLQNLLTSYGNQRDIETEISTAGISSQSFGFLDMSAKPGCSNGKAAKENGTSNRGSWLNPPQRMRTYTKVQKRGSVGRSIDITRYSGYSELRRDLARMFGIEGQLEDPQRTEWKLVYVDHENDILLVGDDPWEEFVSCVQSIKIFSAAEVQQMSVDGELMNLPNQDQAFSGSDSGNNAWAAQYDDNIASFGR